MDLTRPTPHAMYSSTTRGSGNAGSRAISITFAWKNRRSSGWKHWLAATPSSGRLTATIHDLTALIMPQVHTQAIAQADNTFAERILKRVDGLIAVSENTRMDAIRMLGLNPALIRTIHSGVPAAYFDAAPRPRN